LDVKPDSNCPAQTIASEAFGAMAPPTEPPPHVFFQDRLHAGSLLAERLRGLQLSSPVVLGLPRGGVVVAEPVAVSLQAPLDVIIVRKLGVPWQPELAMGAIGEGGVEVIETSVMASAGISDRQMEEVERRERAVLDARIAEYRQCRPAVPLEGRSTVIVDDGIATGATVRAACQVVTSRGALKVIVAVPVATREAIRQIRKVCDEVVCLHTPARFGAIGLFYADFSPVDDLEVKRILKDRLADTQRPDTTHPDMS
jgi:putative phosphoribosyl transferase